MHIKMKGGLATILACATLTVGATLPLSDTTPHYRARLDVAPAASVRSNPSAAEPDGSGQGDVTQQTYLQQMVATVVDRRDQRPITDAKVIAVVTSPTGDASTQTLARHEVDGQVDYEGFVRMPRSGDYRVQLKIYPLGSDRVEIAHFIYSKPGQ